MRLVYIVHVILLLAHVVTPKLDEDYKDELRFLRIQDDSDDEDHYTNVFAVESKAPQEEVEKLADEHNFNIIGKLEFEDGTVYELQHNEVEHRSKRSADDHISILNAHPMVTSVVQQKILIRDKRDTYEHDPPIDEDGKYVDSLVQHNKERDNIPDIDSDGKYADSLISHDKQNDFKIERITDNSIYQRFYSKNDNLVVKDGIPQPAENEMQFSDPAFPDQWYLKNKGQSGGIKFQDLNVEVAWKNGYTGKDISINILDDGLQHSHPDLKKNYYAEISADFNDPNDTHNDPTPNTADISNSHGTRCGGEIAAEANNTVCGVGIAYNANIGGIRILDGKVFDSMEGRALLHKNQIVDICSASWGPRDNGRTMEAPHPYTAKALVEGTTKGRGGKGSIFVWATGNGGGIGDDCGADGYVSSIYTLSVGSINNYGESTYYMERCPSTIAVVYVGGAHDMNDIRPKHPLLKVVTTDVKYHNSDSGCMENFQGTSAASPLGAGCIALALEANKNMTWRDVQHLVIHTARIPNQEEPGWVINGAKLHVNDKFGFGVMDCSKMVERAQTWINVPEQRTCTSNVQKENKQISVGGVLKVNMVVTGCQSSHKKRIDKLEHVQIHVTIKHERRGDLQLSLISPSGTLSEVLSIRPKDDNKDIKFTFMTVHCWDENPKGTWTFQIKDIPSKKRKKKGKPGQLISWSLTLYGTSETGKPQVRDNVPAVSKAEVPNKYDVMKIISKEEDERMKTKSEIVKNGDDEKLEQKKREKLLDQSIDSVLNKVKNGEISQRQLNRVVARLSPAARALFEKKKRIFLEDYHHDHGHIVEPGKDTGSTSEGGEGKNDKYFDSKADKDRLYDNLSRLFSKKSNSQEQEEFTSTQKRKFEDFWDTLED